MEFIYVVTMGCIAEGTNDIVRCASFSIYDAEMYAMVVMKGEFPDCVFERLEIDEGIFFEDKTYDHAALRQHVNVLKIPVLSATGR